MINLHESVDSGLAVLEIFNSIEGEGLRQGLPVTFVRFIGCNLRCVYCDTKYSHTMSSTGWEYGNLGKRYTQKELTKVIKEMSLATGGRVTFTGGEPLMSETNINFIYDFARMNPQHDINIETNGTINPVKLLNREVSNITLTMDYKCASSYANGKSSDDNYFYKLRRKDCLKVVVGSNQDICELKNVLRRCRQLDAEFSVFVHPVYGQITLELLAEVVQQYCDIYQNVRLGYQLHKLIWAPEERGV